MKVTSVVKSILYLLLPIITIAAVQTAAALYFFQKNDLPIKSDLVVVFPGDSDRISAAIHLIKADSATHAMIISKTSNELQSIFNKNKVSDIVRPLPGGSSRSTFEDVYQTAKTLKRYNLKSVVLVTSSYHMSRAIFLLKTYLWLSDNDVHIHTYTVARKKIFQNNLRYYTNENIKLYGSTIEMISSVVAGGRILNNPVARYIQTTTIYYVQGMIKKVSLVRS